MKTILKALFLLIALSTAVPVFAQTDFVSTMARAEAGDTQSQLILGELYFTGEGVPRNYTEAEKWFRVAAEQGLREAQSSLGFMYQEGVGVAQNYQEAVKWFRLAADQRYVFAQAMLGDMYFYGEGVPRNYTEAEKWYRVAAEQGLREAQSSLGYMYQSGVGVAQNYQEALRWHRLAAEQGLILATVDATVNEISQEWFSNPVRAKNYFDGKIVFITGSIGEISINGAVTLRPSLMQDLRTELTMTNGVTVSNFINSELYKIESLNRGQTVTIGCVNLSPSTRQGQGLVCERGYFHDESRQQEYQRQGQVALQQRQLMQQEEQLRRQQEQQEEQLRRQEEQRQKQIVEQECLLMLNCEIKLLNNVQPVYPGRAAMRGIQGWAVVSFTVTETGGVRDVIVVDAEPKDVFNQASIKAAEQFRYQPRYVDGVAVEVSNVRYEFRFNVYVEN